MFRLSVPPYYAHIYMCKKNYQASVNEAINNIDFAPLIYTVMIF